MSKTDRRSYHPKCFLCPETAASGQAAVCAIDTATPAMNAQYCGTTVMKKKQDLPQEK